MADAQHDDALDDILAAFEQLVAENPVEVEGEEPRVENFRCVDCVDCSACRFCTSCRGCVDCTYCETSVECESCTQCRGCTGCIKCSHSLHSAYCQNSSYLALCYGCDTCIHCFACVGLEGEEFCILNEKHTRRDYFKKVAAFKAEIDARAAEGWVPPWMSQRGSIHTAADKAAAATKPTPARASKTIEPPLEDEPVRARGRTSVAASHSSQPAEPAKRAASEASASSAKPQAGRRRDGVDPEPAPPLSRGTSRRDAALPPPPPARLDWEQQPPLRGFAPATPHPTSEVARGRATSEPRAPAQGRDERAGRGGAAARTAERYIEQEADEPEVDDPVSGDDPHSDWSSNFAAAPVDDDASFEAPREPEKPRGRLTRAAPPKRSGAAEAPEAGTRAQAPSDAPAGSLRWGRRPRRES